MSTSLYIFPLRPLGISAWRYLYGNESLLVTLGDHKPAAHYLLVVLRCPDQYRYHYLGKLLVWALGGTGSYGPVQPELRLSAH